MITDNLQNLMDRNDKGVATKSKNNIDEAVFGMGCFWCGQEAFEKLKKTNSSGIILTRTGYSDGPIVNPTYDNHQGHREVIKILFDPQIISYEKLLDIFWLNIDPFDDKGQFCDRGDSYKAIIYYKNNEQFIKAQASKEKMQRLFGEKIVTPMQPLISFYKAEDEHQDYKNNNPIEYKYYVLNCEREESLRKIWNFVNYKDLVKISDINCKSKDSKNKILTEVI